MLLQYTVYVVFVVCPYHELFVIVVI